VEDFNSPFGAKLEKLINETKQSAIRLEFTHQIDNVIGDLTAIVMSAIDTLKASFSEYIEDEHMVDNNLPFEPEQIEKPEDFDTPITDIDTVNVDALILESYTFNKSDEELSDKFSADVKEAIKQYSYLLLTLGVEMHKEEMRKELSRLSNLKKKEN